MKFNIPPLEKYYKGRGCDVCKNTGYKGRIGIYELLQMDTKLKRLVSKNFTVDELWDSARSSGTRSLFEQAWSKVAEGVTTVEEVIAKIPYPTFLEEAKKDKETAREKILTEVE